MKQEDTKLRILDQALELFSAKGYDSVSVGEIAKAVGIKAPSLYNHFPSKQAIFDAIVESTAVQYETDTDKILHYHAGIFRALIAAGEITAEDPDALAMLYVSPVLTLIGICDRQPERESECLEKLQNHVRLFFRMVHGGNAQRGESRE